MNRTIKTVLFWSPRLITILLALFLSLFAADVFSSGYNVVETMIALFMHLIPSFILLIILAISWKQEWVGGLLFIAFSFLYTIITANKFKLDVILLIPLPLFIAGVLFLIGWIMKNKTKEK